MALLVNSAVHQFVDESPHAPTYSTTYPGEITLTEGAGPVLLVADDAQHVTTADSPALTQTVALAPHDAAHGHIVDEVGIFTAPSNVQAAPVNANTINVSWDAVILANAYDIERDSVVIATNVVGTAYSDESLNPLTQYSYRVRAVR